MGHIRKTLILFMILMSGITFCILKSIPLFFGFFVGIISAICIFMKEGYSFYELISMMKKGIKECSTVYIIVLMMGGIISIWIASGIVPTMIHYGFNYIVHMNYLLATFFICAVVSFFMGTAFGTISTIGIALLGIGKTLMIPTPMVLGAIVSGAFIADKISPISALVNLTLTTTQLSYRPFLKSTSYTLLPTFLISGLIYYVLGKAYNTHIQDIQLNQYQEGIMHAYSISPLLLLLPFIMVIFAVLGMKMVKVMGTGLGIGILITYFFQNQSIKSIISYTLYGYQGHTGILKLDSILKGGGMITMLEVILIIIGAVCLNSLLEGTHTIEPIIKEWSKHIRSKGSLIAKTALLSMGLTTFTCDQTVGILLPGKFLKNSYENLGMDKKILARTISDTGTTIAPLVPWNVNGIIISIISGISVSQYGVYTILCYISPLITVLCGYLWKLTEKNVENPQKKTNYY